MKCPVCGKGSLRRATKPDTVTYKGKSVTVNQPGDWCNKCDDAIFTGRDLKATEKELHDFRAVVDGLLPSDEVRRIRIKLGFTQKLCGEIFGGGTNAFSRYERGEATQIRSTDLLLRLLDTRPELLKDILAKQSKKASRKAA